MKKLVRRVLGRILFIEIFLGRVRMRWFFYPLSEWDWSDWSILFCDSGFIFGCSCPWFTFDLVRF
jgi:hypothetical protein